MQYARVCKAFDAIFANMDGTDVAEHLKSLGSEKIKRAIRSAGYAYYNKAARFLLKWANSEYSKPEVLRTADREDIVENITGIGFKLASMFLRNTRGDNVAVLDRHVVRWLGIRNYKANKEHYLKAEGEFLAKADAMHKTPYALDIAIWEAFRTKPQTGETVRSQKSRTKLERLNRKHNMCEKGEGC
jgi:N-glycosylase/DNA lyase